MAQALKTSLPPHQDLIGDYKVRLTAIDPTTGALVAGVNISNVNLKVRNLGGTELASGLFKPLLLRTGG